MCEFLNSFHLQLHRRWAVGSEKARRLWHMNLTVLPEAGPNCLSRVMPMSPVNSTER